MKREPRQNAKHAEVECIQARTASLMSQVGKTMSAPELNLPYSRPKWLSDPFCDYSIDHIERLLATPDEELNWEHFRYLLGPHLPAGTYAESVYFLPLAFDYFLTHEEVALELVSPLVGFVSKNATSLRQDGALDAVRTKLHSCIDRWSSEFTIIHFDRDACREREWGLRYYDYVRYSEILMDFLNDLINFEAHQDLALSFITNMAAADDSPLLSAWYLEFARVQSTSKLPRPMRKQRQIMNLFDDEEMAWNHSTIVRESLPSFDPEATYWLDTFDWLGTAIYE